MSGMMLNLDLGGSHSQSKTSHDHSNQNHKRFVRRRRYLEKKGFLKAKQVPQRVHQQPPGKPYQSYFNQQQYSGFKQRNGASTYSLAERNHERNANSFRNDGFSHFSPLQKVFPKVNHAHRSDYPNTQIGSLVVTVNSNANDSRSASFAPRGRKTGSPGPVTPSMLHKNVSDRHKSGSHSRMDKIDLTNEYESGLPPITISEFPYKLVAIDCEMVGTGPGGRHSDLARCTVVGYHGDVIYDKYIHPLNPITDFRTRWSGIRKHHMKNATPFKAAQKEILKILNGKVVVGHAIHNDFKALNYFHPKPLTRDTSQIPLLNRKAGFNEKEAVSLKRLTKQLLNRDIQVGKNGHSSVEDAKATMDLYRIVEAEWERELACNSVQDKRELGRNRNVCN